jgi:PAT family beta-lactamase induction signal transducer AmpG
MNEKEPSSSRAVWLALRSWRTAAVSLLSFASGLPLGLVLIAIPTWLAREGVDIKVIGLFTLVQAPWTFKFLWSPLMDRYAPPLPRLGRKLAWTLVAQVALLALSLALAGAARHPDAIWIVGSLALAIALASATQDIAIDAYAVEVLRPEEQGLAVGARIALYRAAMFVAGGPAITLAAMWSWPVVFLAIALLFVPMLAVTAFAPRPENEQQAAPTSLRAAVWEPFVGFLSKARALELLAFVILYKLADNLAGALVRPFLVQTGFNDWDVGLATATIGLTATLAGTFFGGMLTTALGLGNALWLFGALQVLSNGGYVLVAEVGVNRPLMYAAMGFESLTSGMGTGAFSVLLLRMTQKQFSATQYALFSSLFALPRLLAGPVTGVMVDAMGWRDFFLATIAVGLPGMLMLQRFSPIGVREPELESLAPITPLPRTRADILRFAAVGAAAGLAVAIGSMLLLAMLRQRKAAPAEPFDFAAGLAAIVFPADVSAALGMFGAVLFSLTAALATAATVAARSRR